MSIHIHIEIHQTHAHMCSNCKIIFNIAFVQNPRHNIDLVIYKDVSRNQASDPLTTSSHANQNSTHNTAPVAENLCLNLWLLVHICFVSNGIILFICLLHFLHLGFLFPSIRNFFLLKGLETNVLDARIFMMIEQSSSW